MAIRKHSPKQDISYEAKCVITGEVTRAKNLMDLSMLLPLTNKAKDTTLFISRMKDGQSSVVKPHHQVRAVVDIAEPEAWPEVSEEEILKECGVWEVTYKGETTYFDNFNNVAIAMALSKDHLRSKLDDGTDMRGVEVRRVLKCYLDKFIPYCYKPIPLPKLANWRPMLNSRKPMAVETKRVSDGVIERWDDIIILGALTNVSVPSIVFVKDGRLPLLPGGYLVRSITDPDWRKPFFTLTQNKYKFVAAYKDGELFQLSRQASDLVGLFGDECLLGIMEDKLDDAPEAGVKVGEYTLKRVFAPVPETI